MLKMLLFLILDPTHPFILVPIYSNNHPYDLPFNSIRDPNQHSMFPQLFSDNGLDSNNGVSTTIPTSTVQQDTQTERLKRNRFMGNKFFIRQNVESSNDDEAINVSTVSPSTTIEQQNDEYFETTTLVPTTTTTAQTLTSVTPLYPPINHLPLQDEPFHQETPSSSQRPFHDFPFHQESNHQNTYQNPPHHLEMFNPPSQDLSYLDGSQNSGYLPDENYKESMYDNNNNLNHQHQHETFYPTPVQQNHYYPTYSPPPTITIGPGKYGHSHTKNVDRISLTTHQPSTSVFHDPLPEQNLQPKTKFKPSPIDMGTFFQPSNYEISRLSKNFVK